ncbi:MAG: hypothetical protein IJX10_02615 [Phascolarctobacterium sp.]|nr:hypothetical protein [Phascolarctobacterium sp.]
MYKIRFYKDKNGKSSVEEYILNLASRRDKDSRIKLNKIIQAKKNLQDLFERSRHHEM